MIPRRAETCLFDVMKRVHPESERITVVRKIKVFVLSTDVRVPVFNPRWKNRLTVQHVERFRNLNEAPARTNHFRPTTYLTGAA
jgi:hypothetical protein